MEDISEVDLSPLSVVPSFPRLFKKLVTSNIGSVNPFLSLDTPLNKEVAVECLEVPTLINLFVVIPVLDSPGTWRAILSGGGEGANVSLKGVGIVADEVVLNAWLCEGKGSRM